MSTTLHLAVSLDAGPEVPERVLDRLVTHMLSDLANTGVESVQRARARQGAVPGDKGIGGPIDLNTLLVAVTSASALTGVIQAVRDFVLRREGRKATIEVTSGGETIKVTYTATPGSEERLMSFVNQLMALVDRPDLYRGA